MDMRGHALFWHSQNPEWLEEAVEDGEYTEDELRDMLEEHVRTVVDRYAGCIQQWDVANEIFDDEEEPQLRDGPADESGNLWIRELGPEILDDVFEWAHEEDPDALLFYNDYSVDGENAKSDAYYELIEEQLDRDVPVHGFGAQTHLSMEYGFDDSYQDNLQRFEDLGLETAVTEIDVRGMVEDDGSMSQEDTEGRCSGTNTFWKPAWSLSPATRTPSGEHWMSTRGSPASSRVRATLLSTASTRTRNGSASPSTASCSARW